MMMDVPTPLNMQRLFSAPVARVFEAWTTLDGWRAWIGPAGVVCEVELLDARPGGRHRLTMETDQGRLTIGGEFREVDSPHRVVFTWGIEDDPERQSLITVQLRALDERTELILRHEGLGSDENRRAHEAGWNSAFETLQRHLEGENP